jgi:hypothetical protein
VPEERDVTRIRAIADQVLTRARRDAAYLASLRANPVAILRAAGLNEADARTVGLDEWYLTGDGGRRGRTTATCRWTDGTVGCAASRCSYVPVTG